MEVIKSAVISQTYRLLEFVAIRASLLARAPFAGPATATLHGKRAGGGTWVAVAALRARRWPKMKEIWVRLLVPHLPKSCASFESRKTGEKGVCLIWTPPCASRVFANNSAHKTLVEKRLHYS